MGAFLVCDDCGSSYPSSEAVWRCSCGALLDLVFEPLFPLDRIENRPATLWRYREALPIDNTKNIVSLGEGFTPLLELEFGGVMVFVKAEHLSPSGSFKDRGASVLISKARELGLKKIIEDSSGNAGAAIAAYCAAAGIDCEIYIPMMTPALKAAQIEAYGAKVVRIEGTREDTAAAALKSAEKTYYASHSRSPFFLEGTKTFAFEIAEQLGWIAPDSLILPVGNGTLLLGAFKGFSELKTAGIVDKIPRLVAVQASNCAPLSSAFQKGLDEPVEARTTPTCAEGIAVAAPARGAQILRVVRETGGFFISVSEDEIKDALRNELARGNFIEPTSAVAMAGVTRYAAQATAGEKIVTAFTGNGLKAVDKIGNIVSPKEYD